MTKVIRSSNSVPQHTSRSKWLIESINNHSGHPDRSPAINGEIQ